MGHLHLLCQAPNVTTTCEEHMSTRRPMQATIMELQQQQLGLQQQLQQQQQQEDDMSLPNTDASFLDEGLHGPQPAPARVQGAALALSRSRQAEVKSSLTICSNCAALSCVLCCPELS